MSIFEFHATWPSRHVSQRLPPWSAPSTRRSWACSEPVAGAAIYFWRYPAFLAIFVVVTPHVFYCHEPMFATVKNMPPPLLFCSVHPSLRTHRLVVHVLVSAIRVPADCAEKSRPSSRVHRPSDFRCALCNPLPCPFMTSTCFTSVRPSMFNASLF